LKSIPVGPDPEPYLASIRKYAEAGFDHLYVHQVGPQQDGFVRFFETEILPAASSFAAPASERAG
jgi:hypothetical protein